MNPKRIPWRKRLKPFAKLLHAVAEIVASMPDKDLRALAKACKKVTPTNCGWTSYQIAPVVLGEIEGERRRRRLYRMVLRQSRARQAKARREKRRAQ